MSARPPSQRFRIDLEALADDAPPVVRLRAALKLFLRRFRLRCERVEELVEDRPADGSEGRLGVDEAAPQSSDGTPPRTSDRLAGERP